MVTEINYFITDEENEKLMGYFESELIDFEATNSSNYLIAKGLFVSPKDDEFLQSICNKALSTINKNWEYIDYVNFMKYDKDGKFKSHYDFIDPTSPANLEDLKNGGQREHTFLIYLNGDCEGGETYFPMLGKTIHPEKNKMIYWPNILTDGTQNILVKHESKKIKSGVKYLVGLWVRQQNLYTKKTLL